MGQSCCGSRDGSNVGTMPMQPEQQDFQAPPDDRAPAEVAQQKVAEPEGQPVFSGPDTSTEDGEKAAVDTKVAESGQEPAAEKLEEVEQVAGKEVPPEEDGEKAAVDTEVAESGQEPAAEKPEEVEQVAGKEAAPEELEVIGEKQAEEQAAEEQAAEEQAAEEQAAEKVEENVEEKVAEKDADKVINTTEKDAAVDENAPVAG